MTKRDPTDRLLSRLQADLATHLGVKPVEDAGALLKATETPASLREHRLVGAGHFDVAPHLLVLDPGLGTLGLVQVVVRDAVEKPEMVRKLVEQAAYLRHLTLTEWRPDGAKSQARAPIERPLPLTVELVLVIPPDDETLRAAVGRVLGEIAQRVAFLHGIGVNLLEYGEATVKEDAGRLRRAFCWLLTATRAWFEGAGGPAPRNGSPQPFTGLLLENWRLPGRRELVLDGSARVHLVHGRNGSGKTTLVEAIEFALTGSVDRLRGIDGVKVADIVEYHPPGSPLSAAASIAFREPWDWTYATRPEKPPEPLVGAPASASSFRLDQAAMERLSGRDDVERARCLLESFFPDEKGARESHRKVREMAVEAFAPLADETWGAMPGSDDLPETEALLERTAWVDAAELRITDAVLRDLLPVPVPTLRALLPLAPEIGAALDLLGGPAIPSAALEEPLNALDDALDRLSSQGPEWIGHLDTAMEALSQESLRGWQPRGEVADADPVQALNDWLESMALADLARRQRVILRSLRGAEGANWKRGKEDGKRGLFRILGLPAIAEAELDEQIARWSAEEEKHLRSASRRGWSAEAAHKSGPETRPTLSAAQVESLDTATPWLLQGTESPQRALGRTIQEAINGDKPLRIGDAMIGAEGWTDDLCQRIAALRGALGEIAARIGGTFRSAARLAALRQLRLKLHDLRAAEDALSRSLLDRFFGPPETPPRDPGLLDALNELVALFTPARWAYAEFTLTRLVDGNGRETLGMHHGGAAHADLRLNTAELNLFTVALFLLCAPRIGNPLHLLVFDDPLQNMDELTATTLARGLAKVVELLDKPWNLILFFHGEDDLERFRHEVPAAVYSLPWLTPALTADAVRHDPIKPLERTDRKLDRARQSAGTLFEVP